MASLFLAIAFLGFILLIHKRGIGSSSGTKAGLLLPAVIGLTTGLAFLTHYLGILAAGVLVFNSLYLLGRRRKWRCIAALLATGSLPAVIGGYFVLHGVGSVPGHLRAFPGALELAIGLLVKMLVFVPAEGPPNAGLALFRLILFITPGLASSRPESDLFGHLSRLIILTFFGGANLFQWFPSFFASKPPEALWRRHQYASSTLHLN